jgi:hypothetical protein
MEVERRLTLHDEVIVINGLGEGIKFDYGRMGRCGHDLDLWDEN